MAKAMRYFLNRKLARGWVALARAVCESEAQDGVDAPQHGPHAQPRAVSWLGRVEEMATERAAFMQKMRKGLSRW